MNTCPACGRPNTGESDFCVCGEFLDWTPEATSEVSRDASATMEAIPYEREVVGPTAIARPPGPAAGTTATAPGPRAEVESRPPPARPRFPATAAAEDPGTVVLAPDVPDRDAVVAAVMAARAAGASSAAAAAAAGAAAGTAAARPAPAPAPPPAPARPGPPAGAASPAADRPGAGAAEPAEPAGAGSAGPGSAASAPASASARGSASPSAPAETAGGAATPAARAPSAPERPWIPRRFPESGGGRAAPASAGPPRSARRFPASPSPGDEEAAAPPPPPRRPPAAPPAEKAPAAPVLLSVRRIQDERDEVVTPVEVSVAAGGRSMLVGWIRNQSGIVDHFELSIKGFPDGWWTITPGTAYLVPFGRGQGYDQEFQVTLHPPRSPQAEARPWEFFLVASSLASGVDVAAVPATVVIEPYQEVEARVEPVQAEGRLGRGTERWCATRRTLPSTSA